MKTIKADVARSLNNNDLVNNNNKMINQKKLMEEIVKYFTINSQHCYFQGFNSIVEILSSTYGDQCTRMLELFC